MPFLQCQIQLSSFLPFQLSIQLQQSSEYWSEKVRELSAQLDITQSASSGNR